MTAAAAHTGAAFFADPERPAPHTLRTVPLCDVAQRVRAAYAGLGLPRAADVGQLPAPTGPLVLPRRSYAALFEISQVLLGLVRRAVLALGSTWPARLERLGADPEAFPLLSALDNAETDHCALLARCDLVVGADGPRLLDLRLDGTFEGPYEAHTLAGVWAGTHAGDGRAPFTGYDPVAARIAAVEEVCARRKLPRALAVLGGPRPSYAGSALPAYEREVAAFRDHGFTAGLFAPGELPGALGRPGSLRYPLGLLSGTGPDAANTRPLRDAQRAGLCLLPPQSGALLADRRALALVSEGLPWMTRGERRVVDRALPWTRITVPGRTRWRDGEAELPGLLLTGRERFVLRRADAAPGSAVFGRRTEQGAWEDAVDLAFREEEWVVQEYVPPLASPWELTDGSAVRTEPVAPVLGVLLCAGRPGGVWARRHPTDPGDNSPAGNAVLTWAS